jgi:hypothetical protein
VKAKYIFSMAMLFLMVLWFSLGAQAYPVQFTYSNFGLLSSPYATGTVELTAEHTVSFDFVLGADFTSVPDAGFMSFGFNSEKNLSDAVFTTGTTGSSPNLIGLPADWLPVGSKNQDGYGKFDYVIGDPSKATRVRELKFSIYDVDLTSEYDVFALAEMGNGDPSFAHFAAHIGPNNLTNTGYIADGGQVPIPPALLLLGSGLIGLAGLRRKKKIL